jgi:hypothetical protein
MANMTPSQIPTNSYVHEVEFLNKRREARQRRAQRYAQWLEYVSQRDRERDRERRERQNDGDIWRDAPYT